MSLTNLEIQNAKPREKPYKLTDGGWLYLFIKPNGSKLWRMDYRLNGKPRSLSIGPYPRVSLVGARKARDEAKKLLGENPPRDPSHDKKVQRINAQRAAANTFGAISQEYLNKLEREGKADATRDKARWLLEDLACPDLGTRPIADITPPELLSVLQKIEVRGRYETARRLRSLCGRVFRFAIATGRAERDPSADLRGALTTPVVKHRSAITEPKAVGELLRAIDGFTGQPVTLAALKLLALSFVRPGELRHAEWSEFDLDAAMWTIPATKMKMRRPHLVPLARQAVAIVRELQPLTGHGKYLFPSLRRASRPMSENTVNAALRRLGYGSDEMTAHGFRSTAATRLNEMGAWNPDAIERQLAHQEENAVRRAYTSQAEYLEERCRMMQAWADYLDELRKRRKT